jgi:hypothetical protein
MPAIGPVVLTDDTTDHTFTPVKGMDGDGVARYRNAGSVAVADQFLTAKARVTETRKRARFTLSVPQVVEETINGVTRSSLERVGYANVEFTFDHTSTGAERTTLLNLLKDLLADPMAVAVVVDGESVW